MKNKYLLPVALLMIIGISACTTPSVTENSVAAQPAVQSASEEMSQTTSQSTSESQSAENLRYVEYSQSILEQSADKRRVLFFYASWCSTCRPADANFTENAGLIPEDVVLIRVNYNDPQTDEEEQALATLYGITYQHTFVQIDGQGNAVTIWNGGQIDELLAKIQ